MFQLLTNNSELQKAIQLTTEQEIVKLLQLVEGHLNDIIQLTKENNNEGELSTDGLCLILVEHFNNVLKKNHYDPKILQGDIELDPNDWLEHHISIIRLANCWITIDFSASQLKQHQEKLFVIILCDPDKKSLLDALTKVYNWWVPDKFRS